MEIRRKKTYGLAERDSELMVKDRRVGRERDSEAILDDRFAEPFLVQQDQAERMSRVGVVGMEADVSQAESKRLVDLTGIGDCQGEHETGVGVLGIDFKRRAGFFLGEFEGGFRLIEFFGGAEGESQSKMMQRGVGASSNQVAQDVDRVVQKPRAFEGDRHAQGGFGTDGLRDRI